LYFGARNVEADPANVFVRVSGDRVGPPMIQYVVGGGGGWGPEIGKKVLTFY